MTTHGVRASLAWSVTSPALFWVGFVLLGFGFVHDALWRGIALGPSLFLGWIALIWAVLAVLLSWFGKWSPATAVLAIGLAALAYFAGVGPAIAVILIGLAALGIGTLCVPEGWGARASLSILCGLAILCGVDGWLLPFPIHVLAVYLPVLLTIIVLRLRAITATLRPVAAEWTTAVGSARWPAAMALLAVGLASTGAWLPTMLFDDLAYHFALPAQLAQFGYYQMNAAGDVWALAPWASNVLQGIAQVLASAEARGPVDALWFALSCVLLWRLCEELKLSAAMRWLAVALLAAVPLTTGLLDSMQTEGPTVAVVLGLALLIAHWSRPNARMIVIIGLLFGLLLGLKVSNLWFIAPLGLWWLWRSRCRLGWRGLPLALLLGLLVAGSSYVYAWTLTGNPVLPIFNGFFKSPWFHAVDFHDNRWDAGFHWNIVWNLVFHSGSYIEGGGNPVFILIALCGCFLVALTRSRARGLALVGAVALLLPLSQIQYLRYAYPALALLIPAMLCGVWTGGIGPRRAWGMWALLWLLVPLSLAFSNSANWELRHGAVEKLVRSGRNAVITRFAPIRLAEAAVRDQYGSAARSLIVGGAWPLAAEMVGQGFVTSWYDPQLSALAAKARADGDASGWSTLFNRSGANFVIMHQGHVSRGLMQAIQARHGVRIYGRAGVNVWHFPPSRRAHFVRAGSHGWQVDFDTTDAPGGDTLGAAKFEFECDPTLASQGHIVVHWHVESAAGVDGDHWEWMPCLQDGVAKTSAHFRVPAKVTVLQATVQPDPSVNMGLKPVSAKASLLHNLTAARDLAFRVRRFVGDRPPRKVSWFVP